jgi:hypothetical protein
MSLSDRVYWLGMEWGWGRLWLCAGGLLGFDSQVACVLSSLLALLERVWVACRWLNLLCV